MSENKKEVMDNNGKIMSVGELKDCPCGGKPDVHFIGNNHTKKQTARIFCTARGCFFEQRVATLGRFSTEWLLEKCLEQWNTRPTETALRAEIDEAKKHTAIREIQAREAQRKLTLARAEVDRLKHYQYNCAEMERVNTRNDELRFQLGKMQAEVEVLRMVISNFHNACIYRETSECNPEIACSECKFLTAPPITPNNEVTEKEK